MDLQTPMHLQSACQRPHLQEEAAEAMLGLLVWVRSMLEPAE